MVDDVLPRHSELQDPAVANVDQVLLVFALERPALDLQGATRRVPSVAGPVHERAQLPLYTLPVLTVCQPAFAKAGRVQKL